MKFSYSPSIVKAASSIVLALVMLSMGIYFFKKEGVPIIQIWAMLIQGDIYWLLFGIGLSAMYIWLHGEMYRQSFRAIGIHVSMRSMMRLYLKRSIVSVFLPAGFIASQTFFSNETARLENIQEGDVWAASGVFSVAALLSTVIVVLPALCWMLTQHILSASLISTFLIVSTFLFALIWSIYSFIRQAAVYRWFQRYLPVLSLRLKGLDWSKFQMCYLLNAILLACIVMAVGILHIIVATRTLGATTTIPMAFAGYIAVLIALMAAPFLRGVGAVEALLSVVLIHFGLSPAVSISAAVLFRFFEFWLVLLFALPVFVLPFLVRPQWLIRK